MSTKRVRNTTIACFTAGMLVVVILALSGCTDPNAGKFPTNKDQVLLQGREGLEGPLTLP